MYTTTTITIISTFHHSIRQTQATATLAERTSSSHPPRSLTTPAPHPHRGTPTRPTATRAPIDIAVGGDLDTSAVAGITVPVPPYAESAMTNSARR